MDGCYTVVCEEISAIRTFLKDGVVVADVEGGAGRGELEEDDFVLREGEEIPFGAA